MKARILFFAAAISAPAFAGWSTTNWGMTREQVRAAVSSPLFDEAKAQPGDERALVGRFATSDYEFSARLRFDRRDRLISVSLDANDPNKCYDLEQSLRAKYGEGKEIGGTITVLTWKDTKARNDVGFILSPEQKNSKLICSVSYSPLPEDLTDGL